MKRLLFSFLLFVLSFSIMGQNNISHTVQRGETCNSIATKYGISLEDLIKANPKAKNFFYAGMTLTIPKAKAQPFPQIEEHNNSVKQSLTKQTVKDILKKKIIKEKTDKSHKEIMDRKFSSIGLTLNFRNSGFYGVQGQVFKSNGIGATLNISSNYGLEDSDFSDVRIKLGPSYIYPLSKRFFVMGTACYSLTFAKRGGNSGMVSGFDIIPLIGVSLNHIKISAGPDIVWRNGYNGDWIDFMLGVSYSF